MLDRAECCNGDISHRLWKTGGSQSPLGVAYATAILVNQGLAEEASKGRVGWVTWAPSRKELLPRAATTCNPSF